MGGHWGKHVQGKCFTIDPQRQATFLGFVDSWQAAHD
jgi:hypothetical protein